MRVIVITCLAGIALSSFALYVEHQKRLNDSYEALCDISHTVSCSKVFSSPQGRILSYLGVVPSEHALDVPNALLGYIFYAFLLFLELAFSRSNLLVLNIMFTMAIGSALFSVYLAYVLMYELKDLCIVCTGNYVCNAIIFIVLWYRWRNSSKAKRQ